MSITHRTESRRTEVAFNFLFHTAETSTSSVVTYSYTTAPAEKPSSEYGPNGRTERDSQLKETVMKLSV